MSLSFGLVNLILQTPRLALRHFTLADAPFILEIMNTPGYLQWIADRNVRTLADAEQQLAGRLMAGYAARGWGNMLACLRKTGEPVGFISLVQRDYLPVPDVGYALLPRHTGQGLAFEATQAVIGYAQSILSLPGLAAITVPQNTVSINLLHKLGALPNGTVTDPATGEELLLFAIDKPFTA